MADKPSVIRETDEEARGLARRLLRGARFVALAVIDPQTGFPSVSRVLIGTDRDGVPVILVSALSAHTRALEKDQRVSLLAGEPAKGDPLAHARLTLQCVGNRVPRDGPDHARLRERFLARHPKAKLYIDFADFGFFRLDPQSASLNGGFGKAYVLPGSDFLIRLDGLADYPGQEAGLLLELGVRFPDLAGRLAYAHCGAKAGKWRLCGVDMAGIDLSSGDLLLRYEFNTPINTVDDIFLDLTNSANPVP